MRNLNIKRQGIKSTKEKNPDTDLEDKFKTNIVFCATIDPSTTKEGDIYSDICRKFHTTSSMKNK